VGHSIAAVLPQMWVTHGYWKHNAGKQRRFRGCVRFWICIVFVSAFDVLVLHGLGLLVSLVPALSTAWASIVQLAASVLPPFLFSCLTWLLDVNHYAYTPFLILSLIMFKIENAIVGPRLWLLHLLFDVPAIVVIAAWDRLGDRMNKLSMSRRVLFLLLLS
jgi:hypothetical protein